MPDGSTPAPEAPARLSFAARAERYARDVVDGRLVAGKYVKAACQRHLDDLARSASDPSWPWRFDEQKAGRPCHFIELLPHIKGKWAKPIVVDGRLVTQRIELAEWQVFIIAVIFGWVNRLTGLRRFRRVYLEVARKNAKSTLAAGLALYMLCADGEQGAEVYSTATKKDQAKIVWEAAREMVRKEPEFRALSVSFTTRAIFQNSTASKYEALGRDSDSLDGLNTHCFVGDELHAQKDRGVHDVLDSSTGARDQPLGIGITTSGTNQGGVCYEIRSYVVRILNSTMLAHGGMGYRVEGDAIQDDTYFGIIYSLDTGYAQPDDATPAPPDDDWADEKNWGKANPNLGISVSLDDLRAKCAKAKLSVQSQPEFRTKHCNQWLGADSAWMDMAKWHAAADPKLRVEDFARQPVHIALDGAFKTDFFAKVKLFERGGHYYAFGNYWIPETQLDVKENPLFVAWRTQGLIEVAQGEVIDIERVRDSLKADRAAFDVREIPYDPAQLTQFATEMIQQGYPMVEMRPIVNNFSEPMKKITELVLQKRFHHNGDPVLAWMVSNVVCHSDAKDNIYPRKPEGQGAKKKIDGVIALIMALGRAMLIQAPTQYPAGYQLMTVG